MLLFETHAHHYPCYRAERWLDALESNALRWLPPGQDASLAVALVEREGQNLFASWRTGQGLPEGAVVHEVDATALRIERPGHAAVTVLAGRQVACRERIEVLGLGCLGAPPDGVPLEAAIEWVRQAGALPVLAWGVGKWLFGRGRTVAEVLGRHAPLELLLGDSSLRPTIWPEPAPMRGALRRGGRVLAGSDPLPRTGEEQWVGRYVTAVEGRFHAGDLTTPLLLETLVNPRNELLRLGRRASLPEFIRRRVLRGRPGRAYSPLAEATDPGTRNVG